MVSGRLFLSRRNQKVVAKVNRPCYYGFARYIKAIDTGDFLLGLVLLTFLTATPILLSTLSTVKRLC